MTRPIETLAQRLKLARKRRDLKQDELAELSGVGQSDISKLERGASQSTAGIARLAAALQIPPLWLELGDGDEPDWSAAQPPKGGPSLGGPDSSVTLAQKLSELKATVGPQTLIWGHLLTTATLPPEFKLALHDDALAPTYPAGSLFVWSTSKTPKVGSVVLVRDSFGQPHVRRYGQGRAPGQWIAEATGPGFLPFDGAEVAVLATAEEEIRSMP